MNYCKDCRYVKKTSNNTYWCVSPDVSLLNKVNGEYELISCALERNQSISNNCCGYDGKHFQPKYTFTDKFKARLNWWLGRNFDEGALK